MPDLYTKYSNMKRKVKFLQDVHQYKKGEEREFRDSLARELVQKGVCEFADVKAPSKSKSKKENK